MRGRGELLASVTLPEWKRAMFLHWLRYNRSRRQHRLADVVPGAMPEPMPLFYEHHEFCESVWKRSLECQFTRYSVAYLENVVFCAAHSKDPFDCWPILGACKLLPWGVCSIPGWFPTWSVYPLRCEQPVPLDNATRSLSSLAPCGGNK